jgi:hypothetical protein
MAQRLSAVSGSVFPDHRQFLVLASGAPGEVAGRALAAGAGRTNFVPSFTSGQVLYADGGVMYVVSEAERVSVQLEAWDARPPVDPEADVSEQAEVELMTGGAQAFALLAPAATPLLRVGPPGRYAVRVDVYRPGGSDDPTYEEAWGDEVWEDEDGSETVVLRFWPVSQVAR